MFEGIHTLIRALGPFADGSDSSANVLLGAIIGGIALVFSTVGPALLGRKSREPRTLRALLDTQRRLRVALEVQAKDAEAERDMWKRTAEAATRGTEIRDQEIERLRGLCVDGGINPFPVRVERPHDE